MRDDGYQLLDSGDGRKLERFGPHLLDRPSPQAVWRRRLDEAAWARAEGFYHRSERGGGHWEWRRELPDRWRVEIDGMPFVVKPTNFGHVGLFVEQAELWPRFRALSNPSGGRPLKVLNLFAYTGAASVACALGGAEVTHVDASKGVVQWAGENAALQGQPLSIRWIVDDVHQFLAREARRGAAYDGALLDPPTYGRGNRGEVFRIEEGLLGLLEGLRRIMPAPRFLFLSCHTPGYTPTVLRHVLDDAGFPGAGRAEGGEMVILSEDARSLPSGTYVLWTA